MFGNLGTTEIILIVLVLLVLFGAKRIPEFAKGIGKGIAQFRRELKEIKDETAEPEAHAPLVQKSFDDVQTNINH